MAKLKDSLILKLNIRGNSWSCSWVICNENVIGLSQHY